MLSRAVCTNGDKISGLKTARKDGAAKSKLRTLEDDLYRKVKKTCFVIFCFVVMSSDTRYDGKRPDFFLDIEVDIELDIELDISESRAKRGRKDK